jgi:PIN domain nuclease of toxin-antitoxin system
MAGSEQITSLARHQIEAPSNQVFVSIVTLWEIAIKTSLGKLTLAQPIDILLPHQLDLNGFHILSIEPEHTFQVARLPFHHRDPFDRLLIAQAMVDHMEIVSRDSLFDAYLFERGLHRIW